MPPTTAAIRPAISGAPEAIAIPSDRGRATRKTTSEAGTSCRRLPRKAPDFSLSTELLTAVLIFDSSKPVDQAAGCCQMRPPLDAGRSNVRGQICAPRKYEEILVDGLVGAMTPKRIHR